MRIVVAAVVVAGVAGVVLGACHAGGEYAGSSMIRNRERGETNGRMFDFVSNRADGDDWNIRIRGTSINVTYGDGDKTQKLGTHTLSKDETSKLWDLIDALDLPSRGKGKKDEDSGYVQLQLREPDDDGGQHAIYSTFVSRENPPDEVVELAEFLQKLMKKHFKTEPNF